MKNIRKIEQLQLILTLFTTSKFQEIDESKKRFVRFNKLFSRFQHFRHCIENLAPSIGCMHANAFISMIWSQRLLWQKQHQKSYCVVFHSFVFFILLFIYIQCTHQRGLCFQLCGTIIFFNCFSFISFISAGRNQFKLCAFTIYKCILFTIYKSSFDVCESVDQYICVCSRLTAMQLNFFTNEGNNKKKE